MLDSIIKIILMVPTSTPKGSTIYRNRAAWPRNHRWQKQNIHGRKTRKNSNNWIDEITNQYTPGGWKEYLEETKIKYDLRKIPTKMRPITQAQRRKYWRPLKPESKKREKIRAKSNLLEGHQGWIPGQPKRYMLQLGKMQASTIFEPRTSINPSKWCGVTSQPVGSLQEYCGIKHNESRFGGWQFLFTKI